MFGRKGLSNPSTSVRPTPPQAASTGGDNVDQAMAILSQSLGIDLEFDMAYVFSPTLWDDPAAAEVLAIERLTPNMAGNRIGLLKSPQTVARLAAAGPDDKVRRLLVESGFGIMLYNPSATNKFNDGMTAMQLGELRKIQDSSASDNAKGLAVLNLMMFSEDVMKGKVKLG